MTFKISLTVALKYSRIINKSKKIHVEKWKRKIKTGGVSDIYTP